MLSAHNKYALSNFYRKEIFALVDKLIQIGNIPEEDVRAAVAEIRNARELKEQVAETKLQRSLDYFGGTIPPHHTEKKRRTDEGPGTSFAEENAKAGDKKESGSKTQEIQLFEKKRRRKGKKGTRQRPFDFSRFSQRHIAIRILYEGGRYSGFAAQGGDEETVEKYLFEALQRTKLIESRETAQYSRCGRTDRGVSALGQVIALKVRSNLPKDMEASEGGPRDETKSSINSMETEKENGAEESGIAAPTSTRKVQTQQTEELEYCTMLNGVLPPDIRALAWTPVSADFSARFSATSRTYRYFFALKAGMDVTSMQQAAKLLEGEHDFRNFCKMDLPNVTNFKRKIHHANIVPVRCCWRPKTDSGCGDDLGGCHDQMLCYFEVQGQAFLWHQVRCMMAVLLMVGKGQEDPTVIQRLLDIQEFPGKPQYDMAPEAPLVLHKCGYRSLAFQYEPQVLWKLQHDLEVQWNEAVCLVGRLRNYMDELVSQQVNRSNVRRLVQYLANGRKGPKVADVNYDAVFKEKDDEMSWQDAYLLILSLGFEPGRRAAHESLLNRACERPYEERIAQLGPRKRDIYLKTLKASKQSEDQDEMFFEQKRKEGTVKA